MQYKPWIVIILGICHILEPVAKILYYSILLNHNPFGLISQQFNSFRVFHIINFFLTFPIAGVAILSVKKWSLPVFLSAQIIVIGDFIFKVPAFYENGQFAIITSSVFFYSINIVLVTYFLGSSLKIAYLDPTVRWWESLPRYVVNIPGENSTGDVKILDLSRTGAYISGSEIPSTVFNLKFNILDEYFSLNCLPVHDMALYDSPGCGVKFTDLGSRDRQKLRKIVRKIDQAGYQRKPEKVPYLKGFYSWFKNTPLSEKVFPVSSQYKRTDSRHESKER